jgi:hypothetical protein
MRTFYSFLDIDVWYWDEVDDLTWPELTMKREFLWDIWRHDEVKLFLRVD